MTGWSDSNQLVMNLPDSRLFSSECEGSMTVRHIPILFNLSTKFFHSLILTVCCEVEVESLEIETDGLYCFSDLYHIKTYLSQY